MAATQLGAPTFGSPDESWGVRRSITSADRAAIAAYRSGHLRPSFYSTFNNQSELEAQWLLQSDDVSHLESCRRPGNIVTTSGGLRLQTLIATDCRARWSTGTMWSRSRQRYGFFEASIRAADISGLNNAFWLKTDDHFEIDIAEIHYPNIVRLTLHNNNHDNVSSDSKHAVGFNSTFQDNFAQSFHDFGVLWTPTDIIYEIDGEPIAAIRTGGAITGSADIRFSTAVMKGAGAIPEHPEGHDMFVRSLRVFPLSQ